MEKTSSSGDNNTDRDVHRLQTGDSNTTLDLEIRAYRKLFGAIPDEHEIPPLLLTPIAQGLAQASQRDRYSLSRVLGNSAPGGVPTSQPNSPRPALPHMDILMVPTPRDPQGMVHDGAQWVTKLMVQMRALSELSTRACGGCSASYLHCRVPRYWPVRKR